ncbi:hypothetical protein A4G28_04295 [Mycobacterium ostraviense]|uniref:Uncharacterized protein n=1 Tax=Mycobacterium ostraviense TaxID=2738409 RepID=A0A164B300_9MYCO|nr:hypothetical protein A4G28_04295 [Mycobacterium ostraviense]
MNIFGVTRSLSWLPFRSAVGVVWWLLDCGRAADDAWAAACERRKRDAAADRLAEHEAQQEVWEPQLTDDEIVAVRQLIEDRFPRFGGYPRVETANTDTRFSSAAVDGSPVAEDGPASATPDPAGAGHPLTAFDLRDAAQAVRRHASYTRAPRAWECLGNKLEAAAAAMK